MLLIRYPGHLQGFNLEVPLSFPAVPMEVFQLVLKKDDTSFCKRRVTNGNIKHDDGC